MAEEIRPSEFFRVYDLGAARRQGSRREPEIHQKRALEKLDRWYESKPFPEAGGILALPTGAGKTYTATRFVCRRAVSDGYKVLWLAHTHHLLEQAFHGFADGIALIAEPKPELRVRVVSGTPGHFPVHAINPSDDVVIGTLQTICGAYHAQHERFEAFLAATEGRLFVVFDEAHHSPAPSYRKLVLALREQLGRMYVLGLTATPTYTEDTKRGWLGKVFPQGIIYQERAQDLMAQGILARPVAREFKTDFGVEFQERDYRKWAATNQDLPEEIVTTLAEDQKRNDFIIDQYVRNREEFGKSIMFADRWFQCEYFRERLLARGVRADVVYSHVDADPGSAEARNRRTKDENARVLEAFRRNELDVLINVRMLTEGTDIPDVKSVFLTRQTTSCIMLTQMIGRALRGPKFGGKAEANIVSFIDNWKHLINWAEYDQWAGDIDPSIPEHGKRPPVHLISIELVRRLAHLMDTGVTMERSPFLTLLPVGWYRVEYVARKGDTDENESVRQLLMVFQGEQDRFDSFIQALLSEDLADLQDEAVTPEDARPRLEAWQQRFFAEQEEHFGSDRLNDLFRIARHIAQSGPPPTPPTFFPFEERERHDLDAIARGFLDKRVDPLQIYRVLRQEYEQVDRLWGTFYITFAQFKSHHDACMNRLLDAVDHGADLVEHRPTFTTPEAIDPREATDEEKQQVKERDGLQCLCCGSASKRTLTVDHIQPYYLGGGNRLDNYQTLCRVCNTIKDTDTISFRDPQTNLTQPPSSFPEFDVPEGAEAAEPSAWYVFLCRSINFYFRCGAVHAVTIGKRGEAFRNWVIQLRSRNNPEWVKPHLERLLNRIRRAKEKAGYKMPERITVWAPDTPSISFSVDRGIEVETPPAGE